MKHKLLFVFALGVTVALHAYVLQTTKVKQDVIAVKPQKKVSPIIHLQRVAIKKPEPVVEPVQEVVPEPPKPVVEEVLVVPPKVIKKKAIQKVLKKVKKKKKIIKKIVKKKKVRTKRKLSKKKTKKKSKTKKVAKVSSKAKRSAPKQKAIKNAYLAKIRRIIEQHKKYPKSAKRMRQQGTAYVKFNISSNGKVRHISLAKKCPFSKLNKAALKILKNIGTFAPIPKEMGVNYLSLTIPIKYQILN